jgi:glycosyltransferase involved in cell wall biosynthesis
MILTLVMYGRIGIRMEARSPQTINRKNWEKEPTVAIISWNAQATIKKTLDSLKNFREIVVVDNGSSDKTVEIVKQYTKNIYVNRVKNLRLLREFALTKITSDWVLFIDTDEVLTKEDKTRLLEIWREKNHRYTGFWLARRNYYGDGKNDYLKRGLFYPDFQLRLFKKMYRYIDTPHEMPNIPLDKTCYCRGVEIYHHQDKRKLFSPSGVKYLFPLSKMYGQNFVGKNFSYLLFNAICRFFDLFFISLTRGKGILDGCFGIIAAFNFASHVSLIYIYAIYLKIKKNN